MLIMMQGCPGSGKSTLAKKLAEEYDAIICSTDNYFIKEGIYKFDFEKLGEYHQFNLEKTIELLSQGKNVIVDNTNILYKYCKPYLDYARKNKIEVKFFRTNGNFQNIHGVPLETVEKMRSNMENIEEMYNNGE